MGRLGILFDASKLGGHLYNYAALRSLLATVDPAKLAGCTLSGGDIRVPKARTKVYCLAIDSDSPALLQSLRLAFQRPELRGLLPPADRFLDSPASLPYLAQIGPNGHLLETAEPWVENAWARSLSAPSPPPPAKPIAPKPVPWIVHSPETTLQVAATFFGLSAGAAIPLIFLLIPALYPVTEIFFSASFPATATTLATSGLFFCGLSHAAFRWRRLTALQRLSTRKVLKDILESGNPIQLAGSHPSPLIRRMQAVTLCWFATPNLVDITALLDQMELEDQRKMRAEGRFSRVFLLILPLFGALGMASEVVFAGQAWPQALRLALPGTGGSLFLLLAVAALELRQERFNRRIHQTLLEYYIPKLEKPKRKQKIMVSDFAVPEAEPALAAYRAQLQAAIERLGGEDDCASEINGLRTYLVSSSIR